MRVGISASVAGASSSAHLNFPGCLLFGILQEGEEVSADSGPNKEGENKEREEGGVEG